MGLFISFLLFPLNQSNEDTSASQNTKFNSTANTEDTEELASTPPELIDILELTSATERRHALYQLLENKSDLRIVDLLEHSFSLDKNQKLLAVQRVLFTELVRINPEQSLEFIWKTDRPRWETLLDTVATYWSTVAPNEALLAFSLLDEPWKSRLIFVVFQCQSSLSEAELAQITESLNLVKIFETWNSFVQLEQVIDEPKDAFDLVLKADISNIHKKKMLSQITRRWVERESSISFSSVYSLVYETFADEKSFYWRTILAEIAATNPRFAWEQLSSLSQEVQKLFNDVIFEEWVEHDPAAAIQAISSQEYMDSMKTELSALLVPWIRAVSDRFLEHIDLVPMEYQIFAIDEAVKHLAHQLSPEELIEFIAQFRQRGFNTLEATDSFVRIWSRRDPLQAIDWVVQNLENGTNGGTTMLWLAMPQVALRNPQRAMDIALEHPVESVLEHSVLSALLNEEEIDTVLSLLPQVRNSYMNETIYGSLGATLLELGRIDDALAVAESLEEPQTPRFYHWLVSAWLRIDVDSLLERLPKLATTSTRAQVANHVLDMQETVPRLTEKELEFVRTFSFKEVDQQ